MRRLSVHLPAELVEKAYDLAELSRSTIDDMVGRILAAEIAQWEQNLPPIPAPPMDFQRALDKNPVAAEFFATVSRRNHFAILHMIEEAKRPDTRARRIERAIGMLTRGETPYRY
jgi:uncharacterized protein YdeI (YjbR/CyaY-like superfamily)